MIETAEQQKYQLLRNKTSDLLELSIKSAIFFYFSCTKCARFFESERSGHKPTGNYVIN